VNADAENQELVFKNKNIEVITNAKVVKIEGKVFVSSLTYEDMNEKKEVTLDPKTLETKTKGLFSAGDCNVSKYKQIVMASGEGAKAALSAYEYIKRNK